MRELEALFHELPAITQQRSTTVLGSALTIFNVDKHVLRRVCLQLEHRT